MKEASGEANLTVITIILIGVIVAVATPIINSMMTNTARRTCCTNFGNTVWENGACHTINDNGSTGAVVPEGSYWDGDSCVGA